MGKKMKKIRMKGIMGTVLALVMVIALAVPAPVNAAAKAKMVVKVTSPKTNVKLSGNTLTVHGKKAVHLNVTSGGKKVTAKTAYKSSNKSVVSAKKGKLTVKKNGKAVITLKYNGMVKKLKVTVGEHKWKAHEKTKTITERYYRCACGIIVSNMGEEEEWEHTLNHILNHEPSNIYSQWQTKKVTYTDYYYCTCGAKKAGEPEPQSDY